MHMPFTCLHHNLPTRQSSLDNGLQVACEQSKAVWYMLKKGKEGRVTLATDMTRKHSLLAYPVHGLHQQGCCLPELYPSANL